MNAFADYIDMTIPMQDGCWTLPRTPKTNGYIRVTVNGEARAAHRIIWETVNGPIPAGMDLDHVCHSDAVAEGRCSGGRCLHRRCVRPDHLRVVSRSENILASAHSVDVKEACPKGHSYRDPRNVMVRASGHRECAECNRMRAAARYAKSLMTHLTTGVDHG
jgi:hypothetical protein